MGDVKAVALIRTELQLQFGDQEKIDAWLEQKRDVFNGQSAKEVMLKGDYDSVIGYIEQSFYGQ